MENFRKLAVPQDLMSELISLIESEKWLSTKEDDIREIPQWMDLSYVPNPTDIQLESYDENKSYWCPVEYMSWANNLMMVFGQKCLSLSVEMWNGAGDDDWHIDDDGGEYVNKIFMVYHTPRTLDQSDGGAFEYKVGNETRSIIPDTGVCISFCCVDSLHRATKMQSDKPRYTVLIRCLTDIPKRDYNNQYQNYPNQLL